MQAIDSVVDQAMQSAGIPYSDLDAIAYTIGPGLSLCLRVGAGKARQLANRHNLPMVPCHHMEAHALVARLSNQVEFPFVCLLISGGHNLLLIVRGVGDYMQVRPTRPSPVQPHPTPVLGIHLILTTLGAHLGRCIGIRMAHHPHYREQ